MSFASQLSQMSQSLANNRRLHLTEITDEASEAQTTVGGLLRAARLRAGEDIGDVARELRIKPEYLVALEEGRPGDMPGRTYAIGFLRSYSEYLGLDTGECLGRFKSEFPSEELAAVSESVAASGGEPGAYDEMRLPHGIPIIFVVLVFASIYGGWTLFRSANEALESRVRPVPEALIEAPAPTPAPAPSDKLPPLPGDVSNIMDPSNLAPEPVFEKAETETAANQTENAVAGDAATQPGSSETPTEAGLSAPAAGLVDLPEAAPPVEAQPPADQAETQSAAPENAAPENATSENAEAATSNTPAPVSRPVSGAEEAASSEPVPPEPTPAETQPTDPAPSDLPASDITEEPLAEVAPAPTVDFGEVVAKAKRTFGAPTRENRVVLRAEREVFVRVETDGANALVLFEGMLQPGELYFVPVTYDAVLVTRDGGAIELFLDRQSKGVAGPEGVALKGLSLAPDKMGR